MRAIWLAARQLWSMIMVLPTYSLARPRRHSRVNFSLSRSGTITAIEGGILREVSVGCRTAKATCNICGVNKRERWCEHYPGRVYNGTKCIVQLDDPTDAYECSFCAVPSQPGAGVVKAYGGEDNKPAPPDPKDDPEVRKALALIALEEKY